MQYIKYFPQILKETNEVILLDTIINPILAGEELNNSKLINEFYLSTATTVGVSMWERVLNLKTIGNLEERKARIRSKLLGLNISLRTKLDTLIGSGNYKISIDAKKCLFTLNLELSAQKFITEITELLETTLPVNLAFEIIMAFNKHSDLKPYTHAQLKAYTHAELNAKKI